jgi:hypothetical protein
VRLEVSGGGLGWVVRDLNEVLFIVCVGMTTKRKSMGILWE